MPGRDRGDEDGGVSEYSAVPARLRKSASAVSAGAPLRERAVRQRARVTPPTSASEEAA
jgi:hypothetical protein